MRGEQTLGGKRFVVRVPALAVVLAGCVAVGLGFPVWAQQPPPLTLPPPPLPEPARLDEGDEAVKTAAVIIENHSSRPWQYRVARSRGAAWTGQYELDPGKSHRFDAPARGEPAVLEMLQYYYRPGHLIIRYGADGGALSYKLLLGQRYAYVEGAGSIGEMVALGPIDEAPKRLPTPDSRLEDTAMWRLQMTANHVLTPVQR